MSLEIDGSTWDHDTEDEFFSDYRRSCSEVLFYLSASDYSLHISVSFKGHTNVAIEAKTRAEIENIFEIFESARDDSKLADSPDKPVIFVGHGRSMQWRDLKDHLHDQHGYAIEAYEVGARAGHAIRDVLEDMLHGSTFAVLVLTGEDETADGKLHARQNVIHEAGLFQGKLGFARAIVLLEDGVEEFSNIHGINQIRFAKGNLRETYGDVLATLRREFPS